MDDGHELRLIHIHAFRHSQSGNQLLVATTLRQLCARARARETNEKEQESMEMAMDGRTDGRTMIAKLEKRTMFEVHLMNGLNLFTIQTERERGGRERCEYTVCALAHLPQI